MSRRIFRSLSLALLWAGSALPPVLAAEGRIPIFAPLVIGANGRYIVTRNIAGGAAPVINIAAPSVDLDLNGFTLTQPAGGPAVILISVAPEQVTIHDGTLVGGTLSIDVPGPGLKLVIDNVRSQGASGPAIHNLDVVSFVVRHSVIQGTGAAGPAILVDGGALHSATIEDNVIRDCGVGGVFFSNGSVAILNNRIAGSGAGIALIGGNGSLLSENTVSGGGGEGILLRATRGAKLFDNVVRENGSHGIHLDLASQDNLLLNNVSTGNGFALPGGHGLFVEGDQNLLERNELNGNSCFGLFFSPAGCSNTFGRNMARGNAGACAAVFCGGPPALFPPQSCNACAGPANSTFGDNLIPGPPVF